jgi:dephospho-CoA kinase
VSLVIAVGGPIASGKSTRSKALAERLEVPRRAFSDVVRAESVLRGRGIERQDLQQTGDELTREGWPAFVERTLTPRPIEHAIVIDGIRHVAAIDEVVRQLPEARVVLVFVNPPDEVIFARVVERGEDPEALFHHVETELPLVQVRADLTVGGVDLEADIAAVLELIDT